MRTLAERSLLRALRQEQDERHSNRAWQIPAPSCPRVLSGDRVEKEEVSLYTRNNWSCKDHLEEVWSSDLPPRLPIRKPNEAHFTVEM